MKDSNIDYWCNDTECRVVTYSTYAFVDLVINDKEIKRFIEFANLVKQVMDRFWVSFASTHSGLNRWIAMIAKLINIAKDPSVCELPRTSITCYELFKLEELDNILKLNKMFRDAFKRYRLYVVKTSMYILNDVLSRIDSLRLVHELTLYEPDGRYKDNPYIDKRFEWILKKYRVYLVHRYIDSKHEVRVYLEDMRGNTDYIGSINLDHAMDKLRKKIDRPTIDSEFIEILTYMVTRSALRMINREIMEKDQD